MLEFVAEHSNKHQFGNFIDDFRKKDDIASFLEIALIELAKFRKDNIRYLGYTIENRPIKTNELQAGKNKSKQQIKKNELILHCKETFARLIVYKFELTTQQVRGDQVITQKCIQEFPIFIPVLIDKYHYKIRGNKYCAPLQIVDSLFYSNQGNVAILKTMARAIAISRSSYTMQDIFGNEYKTFNYFVSIISKKKSHLILFYFGYCGFERTFKFFGADKHVRLIKFGPEDIPYLDKSKLYFKFCQLYLEVDKEKFEKYARFRQFIACVLSVQKRTYGYEEIRNPEKWLSILGGQMLEYNSVIKGKNMINTFINSLDYNTKSLIAQTVENGFIVQQSMFDVVKYVFAHFSDITSKSTVDLSNKRIRLGEYIISIIIKHLYKKLYKFTNKPVKSQDMKHLQDIFKINPQILVHAIIGKSKSKDMNLNILNYCEYTNDNAFYNAGSTATHTGPGSPIEKSKKSNVSIAHRRFNTSACGNESIIETSNTDPGVNVNVTPKAEIDLTTGIFLNTSMSSYNKNKK